MKLSAYTVLSTLILVSCANSAVKVVQTIPEEQTPLEEPTPPEEQTPLEEQTPPEEPTIPKESSSDYPSPLQEQNEFSTTLDGQGWIFRSDLSTPGTWSFLNRERVEDSTRFHFRFGDEGSWNFVFDRQSLSGSGVERQVQQIRVGQDKTIDILKSEDEYALDNLGKKDEATLQAVQSEHSDEMLESLESDAEEHTEAGAHARKVIVQEAVKTGATELLVKWLHPYLKDEADPVVLTSILTALEDGVGYEDKVIDVLEKLVQLEVQDQSVEWLYRLASYLEKPGHRRDISRAVTLYQKLVDDWPFSQWRNWAEDRIIWLNRHYFRLQ